jgi:hypothetical protein
MARLRTHVDRRFVAFAALIAAHFAAAVFAVQATVGLLGLQELRIILPVVVGLLWGQAILLGQFLVFGGKWPILRLLLAAVWFTAVIGFAQPLFRATGGQDALTASCLFLAMPLVFSVLIAAGRWTSGVRVTRYDPKSKHRDDEALRFSLRQLFGLMLLTAVPLAGVRLARDRFGDAFELVLLFGLLPAVEVVVVLPLVSLWAALGGKHPALRSAALTLVGLASVVGPLYIGKAKLQTYWTLGWPVVLPAVVVLGSLLVVRAIGYRYVVDGRVKDLLAPGDHQSGGRKLK